MGPRCAAVCAKRSLPSSTAARDSDLGCACRIPMPPDFPRTARPPRPHTWLCVIPTEGVCGSHRGSVWMPHKGLLLLYNSTMGSQHSTIGSGKSPKNTISGTNGVGKPPFGPKLCEVKATGLGMPTACQTGQKYQKSDKQTGKTGVLGFSGPPRPPQGPLGAREASRGPWLSPRKVWGQTVAS